MCLWGGLLMKRFLLHCGLWVNMQVQQLLHPRYEFKCDIVHHVTTCITNKLVTMHATCVMNIFHMWCNLASSSKWLQRICIKISHTPTNVIGIGWKSLMFYAWSMLVTIFVATYLWLHHIWKCTIGSDYKILVTDMLSEQYILISQSVLLYCLTPS